MSHWNHPKHVVPVNVYVVIVNLGNEAGRSNRTGVQIKSNECERTLMLSSVRTDEPSLAEAHVRLKGQARHGASRGVRSCSAAADVRKSHKPIEIRYLRRIVDISQRRAGI